MPENAEIVGWIFRCDLCGFDDRIEVVDWKRAVDFARAAGWMIRVEERKDRCPKCVMETPDPPSGLSGIGNQ